MKGRGSAKNMVKIITDAANKYPIKSFFLALCILTILFVDVWELFFSLPASFRQKLASGMSTVTTMS
jgi:hypothetical protein